jgi:hypothetical protein
MKRKLYIPLILLITAFVNFTCIKDKYRNRSFTISGHIYNDCSMSPDAFAPLELYQLSAGAITNQPGGTVATDTSDANGYFKFTYTPKNTRQLSIMTPAGFGYNSYLENLPVATNLENLEIIRDGITPVALSLNVIDPHSAGDTLFIQESYFNPFRKIPAPVSPGTIVRGYIRSSRYEYNNGIKKTASIRWYFKSSVGNIKSRDITLDQFCRDTLRLPVDIQ